MLFIEASIFTLFFIGTLSLAIVAVTKLFDVDWGDFHIYQNLVIVLVSVFHPLYALSRLKTYEERNNYSIPHVVNIFSSKILLPVVLLYASILAAYMIKIGIEWSWPKGWISTMILWFAVLGTVAFTFIRYKSNPLNKIERIFKQCFFPFLLLCSIVLAMAIRLRVNEYGLTEPRYIVISLAIFLFAISLFYSLNKNKDVRIALYLFAIMALFIFFSPWNIFEIPVKAQIKRLTSMLETEPVDDTELSQILLFLDSRNELERLNELETIENLFDSIDQEVKLETMLIYRDSYHDYNRNENLEEIADKLGFDFDPYRTVHDLNYFNFHTDQKLRLSLDEYDEMIMINSDKINDLESLCYLSNDKRFVVLNINGLDSIPVSEVFPLSSRIEYNQDNLPFYTYQYQGGNMIYDFFFNNFSGRMEEEKLIIEYFGGLVLVKKI